MKKMLSRITAAALAAGMLVTEASASLVVPDSTDPGTIAGSGMWLVQIYNRAEGDDKDNVDYDIDLSEVASARFTFEVDLDNPDLDGAGLDLFEGNIGGGVVLSCNGGDIYPYKDMPDVEYDSSLSYETSEVHNTYNWASQNWWGCEFVNAAGETVDTNPNTSDEDLTNDNPLSTVNLGNYTYSITADFVNPLTCETDEWDINEIDVMQVCLQEWGADSVPIEITCCEILDADGEVLVWFDGQGNPSLENIADNTDSGSSGSDDDSSIDNPPIGGDDSTDDAREVIELSGTATTTLNDKGNVEGTLYQLKTTTVDGTVELQPTDTICATVAPTDDTVDTSEWVVAYNCFTYEWGGWNGVTSEEGVLELSATVQELMDSISVTDISEFGGLLLQVWNTEADIEIDWTITITPENSTSGGTVAPDEPEEPEEPEHDGWLKFYMQNRGGDWAWFDVEEYIIHFDKEDTAEAFELGWSDIQSAITDESGESLLLAPVEEWESYPAFGIEIGSQYIKEVGDKGRVSAKIEDITITLTDGTSFMIPDRLLAVDLLGVDEGWGIGGYNAYIDLADIIMATFEIEGEAYLELLKSVDSASATVTIDEFIPIAEALPGTAATADAVEITDIEVGKDFVTFTWSESANAESYNIYLVDGNTYTFVEKVTDTTYTYTAEACTEYTFMVCGCAGDWEGDDTQFTVTTHHDYEEEYTVDRKPTCDQTGVQSIHCKNCEARTNITEIETIDHEYSSVVVAPTYERGGYTLHMCLYCDDSYKTDITEMLALPAMTGVAVASREANAITFKWDEYLGLDVDGTMLGYVIEEIADGEVRAGEDIDDITVTQHRYTGLTSSTEYTIQIRAYGIDSAGKTIYTKAVVLENVATLPASITGFAVTGRGSDNLTLSWDKNVTADGYVVQIQENNSWKNVAVIKSADTTSHVVTGLEPNSFYRFRMVAYKSYGTSKLYSKYTGAIPGYTAPAMVTGLNVSAFTDTTMTVSWDENAYADGFILDIYKDGKWQQAADITSAETSVTIEGLTASTLYKFRIKSYASNGSLTINSTYSTAVSATTKPAAMSGVAVSGKTSTTLTVSWDKNDSATGYILQMYADGAWKNIANIKDINTTSYKATGLSASTLYKFRMVAYNNGTGTTLYGKYTGAISGTTAPAAVTNLKMTNRGTDFISVAWDKNDNATGYMVYIYDGTSWELVKTLTSASSVSHKITGLESGKEYKVNVKAYKTVGTEKLIADASMITATTL